MENEQVFEIPGNSTEPAVKYLYRRDVLGADPMSPAMISLQEEIRGSERVQAMLSERGADGRFPWHAYAKWRGAYWTLFLLADLGYPAGDVNLFPLREQVLEWLFNPPPPQPSPPGQWALPSLRGAGIQRGVFDVRIESW